MIQVVNRALEILEFVAQNNNVPVQLKKIAEHIKVNTTTCSNIVQSLAEKNYLENVSRKEGYILGVNSFKLTNNLTYSNKLVTASSEPIDHLAKQLNENCLLGVIKNNKRVIIYLAQADNDLQARTKIEIEDIYTTATGRLLLSFLPEKEQDQCIRNLGIPQNGIWPGVETREDLKAVMNAIKKDGFVQTLSSYGIVGVAIPIWQKDVVVASLCIFLPESRFSPDRKVEIYKNIHETAILINTRLKI